MEHKNIDEARMLNFKMGGLNLKLIELKNLNRFENLSRKELADLLFETGELLIEHNFFINEILKDETI